RTRRSGQVCSPRIIEGELHHTMQFPLYCVLLTPKTQPAHQPLVTRAPTKRPTTSCSVPATNDVGAEPISGEPLDMATTAMSGAALTVPNNSQPNVRSSSAAETVCTDCVRLTMTNLIIGGEIVQARINSINASAEATQLGSGSS